jgi:hypothetical protein
MLLDSEPAWRKILGCLFPHDGAELKLASGLTLSQSNNISTGRGTGLFLYVFSYTTLSCIPGYPFEESQSHFKSWSTTIFPIPYALSKLIEIGKLIENLPGVPLHNEMWTLADEVVRYMLRHSTYQHLGRQLNIQNFFRTLFSRKTLSQIASGELQPTVLTPASHDTMEIRMTPGPQDHGAPLPSPSQKPDVPGVWARKKRGRDHSPETTPSRRDFLHWT